MYDLKQAFSAAPILRILIELPQTFILLWKKNASHNNFENLQTKNSSDTFNIENWARMGE